MIDQDFEAPVTGLNAFPKEDRPGQVNAVFQFYHIMIAIGMFFIALTLYACFLWWRKKLFDKKWLLRIFVFSVFLAQLGNQVGWFAAENGSTTLGCLRSFKNFRSIFSSCYRKSNCIFSHLIFCSVCIVLFLFLYLLNKKIKHGPYDENDNDMEERTFTKDISEEVVKTLNA